MSGTKREHDEIIQSEQDSLRKQKKVRFENDRSDEDAKYLRRIMNPETPADLLLALQNPLSPAAKEMTNLLITGADYAYIIERIIEKYVMQDYQMREKEKEALIRQMWIEDAKQKEQAFLQKKEFEKIQEQAARLHQFSIKDLIMMESNCKRDMAAIKNKMKRIITQQEKVIQRKNNNTKQWQKQKQQQYTGNIQQHNIQLTKFQSQQSGQSEVIPVTINANEVTELINNIIASQPSPVDFVGIVGSSHEKARKAHEIALAQQTTAIEFLPAAPIPAIKPPDNKQYAKQYRVTEELKLNMILAESGSSSDLLRCIKANKKQCRELFKMTSDQLNEQANLIGKADEIQRELHVGQIHLANSKELYNEKVKLLEKIRERQQELKPASSRGR